jgi:hypothetical protein
MFLELARHRQNPSTITSRWNERHSRLDHLFFWRNFDDLFLLDDLV